MTAEEQKIADAAAAKVVVDKAVKDEADRLAKEEADKKALEVDPLKELKEANAKLKEDYENIKKVALKRLGKLPGDADFLGNEELSVAEQIRLALLDKEIESNKKAEEEATKKLIRENSELKLALKNRPNPAIGGDSGQGADVKDNVFSTEQINALKQRAIRLKTDPDKFVEKAKKNFLARK